MNSSWAGSSTYGGHIEVYTFTPFAEPIDFDLNLFDNGSVCGRGPLTGPSSTVNFAAGKKTFEVFFLNRSCFSGAPAAQNLVPIGGGAGRLLTFTFTPSP